MGAFAGFIKAGEMLFKNNPQRNEQHITDEAELKYSEINVEKQIHAREHEKLKEEEAKLDGQIEETERKKNTSHAKARFEYWAGWLGLTINLPLVTTCIFLAYYSIAATFYGKEHIAYLISIGCGIAICIAGHVLLEYLTAVLNGLQIKRFIIITSLIMLCLGLGASILLSKARTLQWELQSHLNTDSVIELQAKEQDKSVDVEKIKKEIETLTSRALIIWFLALDWMSAVLLYLSINQIKNNKELKMLAQRREKVRKRMKYVEGQIACLEAVTKEDIRKSMKSGHARASAKGSPATLFMVIIVLLASILGFIILSETPAFGEEPGIHVLTALDVTSSVSRDRHENELAILRIIDSLKPNDSLKVMLITESTFTNPSYFLEAKLPSKSGYFREEIIRAKKRVIRDFRKRLQELSDGRCATSLFDGIFLFSELLKEDPSKKKVLILLSDMQQTAGGVNSSKMARDGDKILSQLKADGLVPDMRGIEVHVLGVSTHGIDFKAWARLKKFWRKYFTAAGCELKAYTVGRNFNY